MDIQNENYYNFGSTTTGNGTYKLRQNNSEIESSWNPDEIIKIRPSVIVDYLDRDWGYETSKNTAEGWEAITKDVYQDNEGKEFKDKKDRELPKSKLVYEGTETDINNRIILYTQKLFDTEILPKEFKIVELNISKILTTTDEIELNNSVELLEMDKPGGSEILEPNREPTNPGNNPPGHHPTQSDEGESQTVIVTPSTGKNLEYVVPITIGIVTLIILGVGVVIIKKKVL